MRAGAAIAGLLLLVGCDDFSSLDRCSAGDRCNAPCVFAIKAGWSHTCALRDGGEVLCWGNDNAGQLGAAVAVPGPSAVPTPVADLPPVAQISASDDSSDTCAVLADGGLACWGYDSDGILGNGSDIGDPVPEPVRALGLPAVASVAAGVDHTCAIDRQGGLWCWGANDHGQLGIGSSGAAEMQPTQVTGLLQVVEVALGLAHTCALQVDGSVLCWGDDGHGQLGIGSDAGADVPAETGISGVVHVAAALDHSCAIKRDGTVWCWGLNDQGELGDGSEIDRPVPVQAGGIAGAVEIALGGFDSEGYDEAHSCAREADGSVWCWGGNNAGELGNGTTQSSAVPQQALPAGAAAIAAGSQHSCAVRGDGSVWCWGANDYGQLGNGGFTPGLVPVATLPLCPPQR